MNGASQVETDRLLKANELLNCPSLFYGIVHYKHVVTRANWFTSATCNLYICYTVSTPSRKTLSVYYHISHCNVDAF